MHAEKNDSDVYTFSESVIELRTYCKAKRKGIGVVTQKKDCIGDGIITGVSLPQSSAATLCVKRRPVSPGCRRFALTAKICSNRQARWKARSGLSIPLRRYERSTEHQRFRSNAPEIHSTLPHTSPDHTGLPGTVLADVRNTTGPQYQAHFLSVRAAFTSRCCTHHAVSTCTMICHFLTTENSKILRSVA